MTPKEKFVEMAKGITRPGIDEMMAWLEETDFYDAPASTKFHGSVPGGLCAHSITVAKRLLELADSIVLAGDMGGWVENAYNLSQEGKAWVDNSAVVFGAGRVEGDGLVADDAVCEGIVSGNAVVRGHAKIERAAQCMDNCLVCDDAVIEERAVVCDFVTVAEKGVVIAETVAEDDRYISKRTHS